MKKLTKYKLNKISTNLDIAYNSASVSDVEQGKAWYSIANKICLDIGALYDVSELVAASVISALSPRNKWEQNIKDAYAVFDAVVLGLGSNDIKVCTFHANKRKAFALAKSEIEITDASLKTYNFVNNIALLSEEHVTIDIWHLRACLGKNISINSAAIGRVAYAQIKQLTLNKAKELKLTGYEYQAIVWGSVRNS
jgi:hypothetical protein